MQYISMKTNTKFCKKLQIKMHLSRQMSQKNYPQPGKKPRVVLRKNMKKTKQAWEIYPIYISFLSKHGYEHKQELSCCFLSITLIRLIAIIHSFSCPPAGLRISHSVVVNKCIIKSHHGEHLRRNIFMYPMTI